MSTLNEEWAEAQALADKSRAEFDATKSAIADMRTRNNKWRFGGVLNGVFWIARHPLFGEIRANTSQGLLTEVRRIHEREHPQRKWESP